MPPPGPARATPAPRERAPARALGTITRGTTNPNRLRRFDRWICHRMGPALRAHPDPLVVDLGYGASPVTTVELAERLALRTGAGRPVRVVGIEIDPARVAAAEPWARPGVDFRRGGFEVPLAPGEHPLVIRAANVLRQYDEAEVAHAWRRMAGRLALGGLLVEGTCDELGRLAAWVAIPPAGPDAAAVPESLTISVDLRHLGQPSEVAERLPKALIHRNVPGERVHGFLVDLDRAWAAAAPHASFGVRQRWLATVRALRETGTPVLGTPTRWRLGELTVPWSHVAPRPR